MKEHVICATAALGCLGAVLAGGPAAAQQFSADLVSTGAHAGQPTRIYVSDGKLRLESGAGKQGFVIADSKVGTSYVVMPQQRMYMDMAATGGQMTQMLMPANPNDACTAWKEVGKSSHDGEAIESCRRLGSDTVGGRSAIKYEGTTRKGEHGFAWVDAKLGFMLKTEMADGEGMELRNIHEGPQPPNLFAIPTDYHKVDMKGLMQRQMKPQD